MILTEKQMNIKEKIDKQYDAIFQIDVDDDVDVDDDDYHYYTKLQTVNFDSMLANLQNWVYNLRMYPFTISEFIKFKYLLIESSRDFQELVVYDTPSPFPDKPYVTFDLNWDIITNQKAVVVAHMMLENFIGVVSPRIDPSKSIWSFVDELDNELKL